MSRVFVVQDQTWINPKSGKSEPKFDFTSAIKFGEIKFILGNKTRPFMINNAICEIKERLSDFDASDFLLLTGNPTLIGICVAIAAQVSSRLKILQWDGMRREYVLIEADLNYRLGE